jgi:hypothetical protein
MKSCFLFLFLDNTERIQTPTEKREKIEELKRV